MNIEQARFNMIEQQIRPWNVLEKDILDLLASMRRDQFTPDAYRNLAFSDIEIPLAGTTGDAAQVMLAPRVEARMLQDLHVQAHERVLEIGAGSGFMAALLAARAKEVITLDTSEAMVAMARSNLARAGIGNVDVRCTDGAKDTQTLGSFDAIVLSGSVQEIPQALLEQLNVGGRLIAIVGDEPIMRARVVRRDATSTWSAIEPWDAVAPPERFCRRLQFSFLSAMQQITPADWASWAEQQNTRPVLLDVREAWELQTASVQTDAADLLHMPMNTVPARLMELDRQRPVACLCHHGARSMQVAHFLAAQGFETVNIAGGIHAWSVQVDPRIPLY